MSEVSYPALPSEIQQGLGMAATQRLEIRERKMTEAELRGDVKPATLLNLSPFELSLGDGLISFKIPRCPDDKRFYSFTRSKCVSFPIYKGNQEMSDRSLQARFDVNIVLPVQQLMEFKHYYMGESQEDQAAKQGGVVVFEGDGADLTPKSEVKSPYFLFRKNNRYIVYAVRTLGELVSEAEEIMQRRCMSRITQADTWFDNEKTRANIQFAEHTWHDFALRKQWITVARAWRTTHVRVEDRCPRCAKQYVSKTGVCGCGHIVDPFVAYFSSEITVDHVRMGSLNKAQWAKVKDEEKRRTEARA